MAPKPTKADKNPAIEYNLLHHLSKKSPTLQCITKVKHKTNSKHQTWQRPSRIVKWQDFNRDSLMKCCGGLFYRTLGDSIEPMAFPYLEDETIQFGNEDALEKHFISPWTVPIVTTALKHAQSKLIGRGVHPPFVKMAAGGNAQSNPKSRPDWAGIRSSESDSGKITNILPGDTKLSSKWKSTWIKPRKIEPADLNEAWMWPIRQLFTYCMNFGTRYGYIITDEEVVAFRISVPLHRLQESQPDENVHVPEDRGTVEFMPIRELLQAAGDKEATGSEQSAGERKTTCDQKAAGFKKVASFKKAVVDEKSTGDSEIGGANEVADDSDLTMNLAIWWLHLLAANNRNLQNDYDTLADEVVEGLGRAPTPPAQEEATASSEIAALNRASPVSTNRSFDTVTDPDPIIPSQRSTFAMPSGSPVGLGHSFESALSSGSTRSKRKQDNKGPAVPEKKRARMKR